MEHAGELHHKTPGGEEIYSTEKEISPEELAHSRKEQEEFNYKYSKFLLGKGPDPRYPGERKNNVIQFPKPGEEKKKAA